MRDKALDLGYTWDVTKYPTPAWDINLGGLRYDRPLRLWSCDCAERVSHIYEDWARVNFLEGLDVCREVIQAGRDYANGLISEEELGRVRRASLMLLIRHLRYYDEDANDAIYTGEVAYSAADAVFNATDFASAYSVVVYAVYAASNRPAEEVWYSGALAQRLDKVAPWHL